MTTAVTMQDIVDRTHRMVNGSRRQTFNVLATTIDDTNTVIPFSQPMSGITPGSFLGVDNEIMYVFSISSGGQNATVRRGIFDTVPAAHTADTLVEIDWRWFTADVLDAVGDDIRSWPEDIFAVGQVDVAIGTATAVDLPLTNYRYVLSIKRTISGNDHWIDEPVETYRVDTGLPASSFPSTNALYLPNLNAGIGLARVTYAADFAVDPLNLATPLSAIPLANSLVDAAIYGAAWRLLISAESPRSSTESQPEPRTVADVHEGSALSTGLRYKQVRDSRLKEEAMRLRGKYPLGFG